MKKWEKIIDKAQNLLKNRPINTIHDIEHHRNVVFNCGKIIEQENLIVNSTNIIIAAWWHDVESQQGATELLQNEMRSLGFDKDAIAAVTNIIHSHTYGQRPQTVEAQVLFDADKIEYFNPERMRKALKEAKAGLLPIPILKKHYLEWRKRHKDILESFNFGTSKKITLRNLSATLAEVKKITTFLKNRE